jgi:ATP synthase I chain
MKEFKDSSAENESASAPGDLEGRIFRVMSACVVLAVVVAALVAPWRIATGLLLGGSLSLLNYRWLSSSVGALISAYAAGGSAAKGSRYILRYFVISAAVIVAVKLDFVSLPATIFGLCSFVIAFLAEASRQFYFILVHREGIN